MPYNDTDLGQQFRSNAWLRDDIKSFLDPVLT